MNSKMRLIAASVQAVLCLVACQSLPSGGYALKTAPAEPVRHSVSPPDALYAIGRYHQGQVRYDKAIEAYTRLLADDPTHAEARNALGIILANQGKQDAAIAEFVKAVEYAPGSASIRNNLGYAYLLQGRINEAVTAFEIAAQLDPAYQRARDNLWLALAQGEKEQNLTLAGQPGMEKHETVMPPVTKVVPPKPQMQLVAVSENVFTLQPQSSPPVNSSHIIEPPLQRPAPQLAQLAQLPEVGILSEKKARLEVSNGNGVTGLAKKTSNHLGNAGYHKIRMTNELPYRQAVSEIQYRPGYETQAHHLQTALQPGVLMVASTTLRSDVQVRLVLGKDIKAVPEVVVALRPEIVTALR
jgi:tetratricopeptide (TPR) repeat protein